MSRSTTPVLFLPLAALLAVAFPFAFKSRQNSVPLSSVPLSSVTGKRNAPKIQHKEASPVPKGGDPLSPDKHNANRILSQYFGVPDYRTASFSPNDARSTYCVHFLIATVPDPIDSRLPHLFDRFLGSIERAAEADDYVLDRYDLPWIEDLNKKQPAAGAPDPSSAAAASESGEAHDYLREPGYILFREPLNDNGKPQVLVVFVVGETPTAGIHKDALLSALQQIDALSPKEGEKPECVKILGPSFSGSAESLRTVLLDWLLESKTTARQGAGQRKIHIVSGSATAVSTKSQPPSTSQPPSKVPSPPYYFDLRSAGGDARFETTVISDVAALNDFFAYLANKRVRPYKGSIRVGLLTEANTSYGNSLRNFRNPSSSFPRATTSEKSQSSQASTGSQTQSATASPCLAQAPDATSQQSSCAFNEAVSLTALPFPLHISELRSELEKAAAQQNKNSDQPAQNQDSSKYLPVPFEDESAESTDSIPPFSQLETPTSELVLSNLLSTLSQEHFDYVGIAASDVRDTIFLAREVREHSPSSVLFSLNADLLYAHPEANPNTRGMLVITPYPLFTLNQVWTNPSRERPRLQFQDQNSEGVYNAMLLLISGDGKLLEYGVPFRGIPDAPKVSFPSQALADRFGRPPLWLTTVGRNGFWPVALLPDRCPSPQIHQAPEAAAQSPGTSTSSAGVAAAYAQGTMPHATIFALFTWSCLCAVPAFVLLRLEHRARSMSRSPAGKNVARAPRFLCESVLTRTRGECRTYFLVAGIALLSAYIVALAAVGVSSFSAREFSLRTCLFLLMIAAAGLTLCACLLLARDAIGLPGGVAAPQKPNRWLWVPVLLVGVVGLVLASGLGWEWYSARFGSDPDSSYGVNGIVTGYRVLNLASGVSPLIPIFLIALAACAWAISAVRRVRLAEALPWTLKSDCDGQEDIPCAQDMESLFNSKKLSFAGFAPIEESVQELLRAPSLNLPGSLRGASILAAGVVAAAVIYLFYGRLVEAFESPVFYLLFGLCFLLVYLSIVFNTLRLLFLWLSLSRLLRNIERHRLRRAFPRFYRNYPNLPRINLASAPPPLTALSFSVEQAQELLRSARALLSSGVPLAAAIERAAPHITTAASIQQSALASETAKDACSSLVSQLRAQRALARASFEIEDGLSCIWSSGSPAPASGNKSDEDAYKLTEQAEEFLVGRTLLFLSHIFPQMTNLAGLSLASLLLLLMAVSSYPFQPHQLIVLFSWIIIFAFVGVALYMSVQMNRDTLLSNLNGTKPGELSWDREFVSRILLYVVIPILGFLGVQFPDTLAQLFSFLSPGAAGHS